MNKKIIKYTFNDKKDWYDLTYRITETCSHKCRYCEFYNNKIKTHSQCWEEVGNFIEQKLKGKKIRLYIYGGEPTTHPQLLEIIKHLSPLVTTICIQTNLYGNIELIKKIFYFKNVYFLPTFHIEKEKDYSLFLKKVLLINLHKRFWELTFLLPLKNFNYNYKTFLSFEKILKNKVVPQPLIGEEEEWMKKDILTKYLKNKKDEMFRHYSDGTIEGISMSEWRKNKEDFVHGWECSSGIDTLYIEWNGDIFQCLSDMYQNGKPIGNVFLLKEDYLSNLKKQCPYSHCRFSTHVTIKKGV